MAVLVRNDGDDVQEVQPRRGGRFTDKELRRLTGGTRFQIVRGGRRAEVEVIGWKLHPVLLENVPVDVVLCREAELPAQTKRWWWPLTLAAHPVLDVGSELPTLASSLL